MQRLGPSTQTNKRHAKANAHVIADNRPVAAKPPAPLAPAAPTLPIITFTPRSLG